MTYKKLFDAICNHSATNLLSLLEAGNDPNKDVTGWGHVGDAIVELDDGGSIEIVRLLLEYGADVNFYTGATSPFHLAMDTMNKQLIHLLLESGANCNIPDEDEGLPLKYAVSEGKFDIAELLLKYKAHLSINQNSGLCGCTALDVAASKLDLRLIKLLINNGASPLIKDIDGYSPIFSLPNIDDSDPKVWKEAYNLLKTPKEKSE